MSQPPLSQTIKTLEQRLGTKLLTRTTRAVALTSAGEVLLEQCRRLVNMADEAETATRDAASGQLGRLRIGAVTSAFFEPLPPCSPSSAASTPASTRLCVARHSRCRSRAGRPRHRRRPRPSTCHATRHRAPNPPGGEVRSGGPRHVGPHPRRCSRFGRHRPRAVDSAPATHLFRLPRPGCGLLPSGRVLASGHQHRRLHRQPARHGCRRHRRRHRAGQRRRARSQPARPRPGRAYQEADHHRTRGFVA